MAASPPDSTYTKMSERRTGSPAVRAASGLPPIATNRLPNTVLWTTTPTITASPIATSTPVCNPPISCLLPIERIVGSKISVSRPSAIINASPRPAMNSPRVATIGCTRTTPTSSPLKTPASNPAPRAAAIAIHGP